MSAASKFPLLAPLAQDLLSAPASLANMERVCSVCKDLSAGKNESPDKESGESGVPEFISTCVCAKCCTACFVTVTRKFSKADKPAR